MAGEVEFVVGTETKVELVSRTHGAVRVPLNQNFDYTPSFDERRLFEFDRSDAIAVVTNFNGVEIAFSHFDSASKLVDAMVNDVDPSAVATLDDPANYQDLTLFLNIRSRSTKKIFQSVLVKFAKLNGAASAEPVREEGTISRTGISTNVFRIKGAALEYTRALRAGSTGFAQVSVNSAVDKTAVLNAGNYEWTVDNTPQVFAANDTNLDGKALVLVLKNGAEFINATLTGSTVKIPEADFGANDVFEAFTTYVD